MPQAGRPRALDLFCKAGGVSVGLERAGFDVTAVDIEPQPHHRGGHFIQGDALTFPLEGYDFIWASPPCQAHCSLKSLHPHRRHADLIPQIRARLAAEGGAWVIENVPRAPLRVDLILCGQMFGLRVYRHRHFESTIPLSAPPHPPHLERVGSHRAHQVKAHFLAGGMVSITGNRGSFCGPAMGIDWMTGRELSQAIPPAYAEWVGRRALEHLRA